MSIRNLLSVQGHCLHVVRGPVLCNYQDTVNGAEFEAGPLGTNVDVNGFVDGYVDPLGRRESVDTSVQYVGRCRCKGTYADVVFADEDTWSLLFVLRTSTWPSVADSGDTESEWISVLGPDSVDRSDEDNGCVKTRGIAWRARAESNNDVRETKLLILQHHFC